jgi:hypothetical protein
MFEGGGATQFLQFWADDMTLKCPIMMAVEKQMKQDYEKRMCALEHAAFALECCRLKLSHNLRKLSKLLTSRSARELASHVQPPFLILTYVNPEPQWIRSVSIRLSHLCDIQNAARIRPCPP